MAKIKDPNRLTTVSITYAQSKRLAALKVQKDFVNMDETVKYLLDKASA